ncbi:4'-phosphopantetheinyl transferase family protein [Sporolactobacillus inulinus]|jgi:4'-phosphopantetheinyl transferase|uniref:4'-phosphopantetheinyl transferase n=1 Tax=Sporolactobacillus inulinus TaxID=2078 RepID=A0A4Y1ZI76_9BACL|nr:4'-phosphopantetheinyl transferase superfamily protein [Sporolactobacillus inulinus]GAY78729.1 4'-phosphopantetheinyl transferase [Sporolactobacillus inulinus]GEB76767.1 4'-phosphopantetheinyl transferase [Sporolactobacillus inulinus]
MIWAIKLDFNIEVLRYKKLLSRISKERIVRIKEYRKQEDKIRSVFAELLVRYAVNQFSGCSKQEIKFCTGINGKPRLMTPKNVHFNLSHSGSWVVCVVDNEPVGIDIEKIQDIELDVAQQFFTQKECEFLKLSKNSLERKKRFFKIWTMKECFLKAVGEGLSRDLSSFSIELNQNRYPKISTTSEGENLNCIWKFKQYEIDNDYILSVADTRKTEKVQMVDSQIFYDGAVPSTNYPEV